MRSPFVERAQATIRAAEGILAFFGVEQIDWSNPEESYIPASAEERERLGIFSMTRSSRKATALDMPPTAFDIIGRSLICADKILPHEIPLAFFRKGKNDTYENRHIEACIDFLFMIETLYANGKFKTSQVLSEYLSSRPLLEAIDRAARDPDLTRIAQHRGQRHHASFVLNYQSKTPAQIAERFIHLRGLLHHHTLKDKDRWHPDRHDEFLADALFLEQVCFHVGFNLFSGEVFSKDSEALYMASHPAPQADGRSRECRSDKKSAEINPTPTTFIPLEPPA